MVKQQLRKYHLLENGAVPQFHSPALRHLPTEEEKKHGKKGSEAHYLVDYYAGFDRVLVSYLPPHSKTSEHEHNMPLIEEYHPLRGEFNLNGEVLPSEGLLILPGFKHRGNTGDPDALTLIIMRNAAIIPEQNQHIQSIDSLALSPNPNGGAKL